MDSENTPITEYFIEKDATLERIIFHIVGPSLETPKILMEVETPETYSKFFIARIEETLRGTRYTFKDDSWVKKQVTNAISSQHAFSDTSERLASKFQELFKSDGRLAPGALMLLQIKNGPKSYGAIIKYDDMSVISYTTETLTNGKAKPILNQLLNNFVQDKRAIQKSIVFDISCPASSIICTDRSGTNGDITDKLKSYLEADRVFTTETLTQRLIAALEETGKEHAELLPKEIRKKLNQQIKQAVKNIIEFNPEHPEQVLTAAFGEAHANEALQKTFAKSLKKRKILTEQFKIATHSIETSTHKIKQTLEGVKVIYKTEDIGESIFFDDVGGKKIIRIETDHYLIDDDTNE